MKPIKRVVDLIKYNGLNVSTLEKMINASNGSISSAIKRDSSLKDETIIKILEVFPEVTCEWLLLGEGEMLKKTNSEEGLEEKNKNTEDFLLDHIESLKQENSHLKDSNTYLQNKLDECHKLHSKEGKHAC